MIKFNNYKKVFIDSLNLIDESKIELLVKHIQKLKKESGRLFVLGIGGSAGNASHAVYNFSTDPRYAIQITGYLQ